MNPTTKNGAVMEEQGLAKAGDRTPAVITTPDEFRAALQRWQERYHVLTAFTNISGLAVSHGIQTSVIQVNNDPAKGGPGEVYDGLPFLKRGEVAIAKNGLRKIAEGLGISTQLEYISVGPIRHYWHVKVIASYRGIDGATVYREASQEWDLRDGSDRLKGWTPNQVSEARKNGLRACETRAINAAIRECGCGIKQAYTREELSRPFVAVRVAFLPDMSDPETKRQVTERALGGTRALYPVVHQDVPADEPPDEPETPRNVGRGSTAGAQPSSTTAPSTAATQPNPDEPPTVDAVRIVDVRSKTGETKGKAWTRYGISDSTGVEHSTFDKKLAEFAEKAKAEKLWVEIMSQTDGQYTNLVEIAPAGEQPSLLPEPGDL